MTYIFDKAKGKLVPIQKHEIRMRDQYGKYITGAKDPGDPDVAVPRALRSFSSAQEREFLRNAPWDASHVRRVWEM